ncbi:MAG: class I SAM-dependent methyltransferase, partial [Alphaproteobacteria bacterium]
RHDVFPEAKHDEIARFNFLANLNKHLASVIGPGNKLAYETRVKPKFRAEHGRDPETRQEVRKAMSRDPHYQIWSALRRNTMEMRQQAGRSMVLRQLDDLNRKAAALNEGKPTLKLDPTLKLPNYISGVDHHCMPGSYHTELVKDDVSAAANYDAGLFVTTGGALGAFSDGGGAAVAEYVKTHYPDFAPKRILDLGCGLGHNVLPIAAAYPDAEVIAVDVAAPMLRYGHARAQSLGITNVTFLQANAENLGFEDESFDWIQTTMFLHETSTSAMTRVMKEIYRMLRKGGLMFHVEQPQYTPDMDVYEQFIRDWDAFNNNEPFWSQMHDIDVFDLMEKSGFARDSLFEVGVRAVVDRSIFPEAPTGETEDHGRAAVWNAFGAWK